MSSSNAKADASTEGGASGTGGTADAAGGTAGIAGSAGNGGGSDAGTDATSDASDATADATSDAGCVPKTCAQLGADCGTTLDGCDGTVACGTCPSGLICGGGGPNTCGTSSCAPKTCVMLGASCGLVSDGCNEVLVCGACIAPETCGGAGAENQCGCVCTRDHASTSCGGSGCVIVACESGFVDCDGNGDNGCEANLLSDLSHCGGCGQTCASVHGSATCSGGTCVISCSTGYGDCDGNAANGCEHDVSSDPINCGACERDCLGGNCLAGTCQPVTLYTGSPYRLAVDATHVYFEDLQSIVRVPLDGGPENFLDAGDTQSKLDGFAINATTVLWADFGYNRIESISKNGSGFATVATTDGCWEGALALSATHVFYTCGGSGEVVRRPLGGGSELVLSLGNSWPYGIVTDGTWVWFTEYSGGRLRRVSVNGGTTINVATDQSGPSDVAVEPGTVYWTNAGVGSENGSVMRVPSGGGAAIALAQSPEPWGIAIDSTHVYWGNYQDNGTVERVAKAGGTVETLATFQDWPLFVAVDDKSIYWTTITRVMRLAK